MFAQVLGSVSIDEGGATDALAFTIGDAETSPDALTVSVSSSNGSMVQADGFELTVAPLLSAPFSEWVRSTALPRGLTSNPVGEAAEEGQALPQVEDINRIKVQDDAASFDDLIPPEDPEEEA